MATKKTVEHSKHFAKVKKYYDKGLWSQGARVQGGRVQVDHRRRVQGNHRGRVRGGRVVDIEAVALTAFVSGLVGAVVSGLVAALKSQGKKAVERSEEERPPTRP